MNAQNENWIIVIGRGNMLILMNALFLSRNSTHHSVGEMHGLQMRIMDGIGFWQEFKAALGSYLRGDTRKNCPVIL